MISDNLKIACDILEDEGMESLAEAIRQGGTSSAKVYAVKSGEKWALNSYRQTSKLQEAKMYSKIGSARSMVTLRDKQRSVRTSNAVAEFVLIPVGELQTKKNGKWENA